MMDIAANGKMKVIVKKSQHLTAPDLTYQQTRNKSEQYDHQSFNGRIYSSYLITISGTLPPSPSPSSQLITSKVRSSSKTIRRQAPFSLSHSFKDLAKEVKNRRIKKHRRRSRSKKRRRAPPHTAFSKRHSIWFEPTAAEENAVESDKERLEGARKTPGQVDKVAFREGFRAERDSVLPFTPSRPRQPPPRLCSPAPPSSSSKA